MKALRGWFGGGSRALGPIQERLVNEQDEAADVRVCVGCGHLLGFDPEDEVDGDGPGRDLCGECNRARNFDAELEMLWAHDDR